jgi:porin
VLAIISTPISTPGKAQEVPPQGAELQGTADQGATATPSSIGNRSTLSGDWWGARTELANSGLNLRLWATGYYQGQWSGDAGVITAADGRGTRFFTGGRLDALIDLDTTKLGLWRGGGFHAHLELEGGRVPGFRGGALWPVNTGAILPLGTPEELEATSMYVS